MVRGGPRRFGWEADGQTLVSAEAELLREVAARVENGESLTTIALDFQRRQIPTVGGRKWTRTALDNILRNPRLGGIRAYTGVFHENQPKVNEWWLRAVRYDGEWVRGDWTPILTADEWILLQNTLDAGTGRGAKNVRTPAPTGRKHLLSGLCICGKCDTRMVGRMVRSMRMYGCRPKDLGGCDGVSRNADKVDRLVIALAIDYIARENVRPRRGGAGRAVKAGDLERLQARKAGLRTAWSRGQINNEDFYATLAELNGRIDAARAAGAQDENVRQLPSRETQIAELESAAVSNERKRLILSEIIERITIKPSSRGPHFNPDDIDVIWRQRP